MTTQEPVDPFTEEEWEKLPIRSRLLLAAGFVNPYEVAEGWRKHWLEEEKLC